MGLLFILQVIYEHGKPWWNVIDRGKLLIRPPELWHFYQQSSRSKARGTSKEMMNLALQSILIILRRRVL
jgi:hypothetical protein